MIEDVLNSRGKMRILKYLSKNENVSVKHISKQIGLNYGTTLSHINLLEQEQILSKKLIGKKRLILYGDSNKARTIKALLHAWEDSS